MLSTLPHYSVSVLRSALILLALQFPLSPNQSNDPLLKQNGGSTYVPNQLILQINPETTSQNISRLHHTIGATVIKSNPTKNSQVVSVLSISEAKELYQSSKYIDQIDLNYHSYGLGTVNDPKFVDETQYAITGINADDAWDIATGDGVTVAVMDTGILPTHEDMVDNLVAGRNIQADNDDTSDGCSHGTAVAGILGAVGNNSLGGAGIAYDVSIMPLKIYNGCSWSTSDFEDGVPWAYNNGASIINFSGGLNTDSLRLYAATEDAHDNDVLLIAGAGNSNEAGNQYPAMYDNVLGVIALNSDDTKYSTSNYWQDHVSAPGNALYTTYSNGSYVNFSQTSASTPVVSGVAALIKEANPSLTSSQICWLIKAEATDIGNSETYGWGKVNALASVNAALDESYSYPPDCRGFNPTESYGWTYTFDGSLANNTMEVAIDSNDNIYATGKAGVSVDLDPTISTDTHGALPFLTKYSKDGTYQYSYSFSGSSGAEGNGVAIDGSDNVYLTGATQGTSVDLDGTAGTDTYTTTGQALYITKYNSDGDYQWAHVVGDTGVRGQAVDVDSSGNAYVIGTFTGTVDFDPSGSTDEHVAGAAVDIFITKVDTSGAYQWTRTITTDATETAYDIAVTPGGDVYYTGTFTGTETIDFDPTGGTDSQSGSDGTDFFVSKLDTSGNYDWTVVIGGSTDDTAQSLAVNSSGDVYIGGSYTGTVDFDAGAGTESHSAVQASDLDMFLTKYDTDGDHVWTETADAMYGTDVIYDVKLNSFGNVVFTADVSDVFNDLDLTSGTDDSNDHLRDTTIISEYTSSGSYVGSHAIGNTDTNIFAYGIGVDSVHGFVITGRYSNSNDRANVSSDSSDHGITGVGGSDIYIAHHKALNQPEPTLTYTAHANPTADATPTISGTATDDETTVASVEYQIDSISGSWSTCTADDGTFDEASEAYSCTSASLTEGDHTMYIRATDSDGYVTAFDRYMEDTFTVDLTAPTLSLTAVTDPTSDTTPTLTGTATEALETVGSVEFQVDATGGSWTACTATDGEFDEKIEAFTCNITSTLSEGEHTMYVRTTDEVSNLSSNSSDTFTINTSAPSITLTAVTNPTSDTTPNLKGAATDTIDTISSVEFQADATDGSWTACTADDGTFDEISEAFTCTVTSALSTNANHILYARATDAGSNTSGGYASNTFLVSGVSDTTIAPSLKLNTAKRDQRQSSNGSDNTTQLTENTVTKSDNLSLSWERPSNTDNIDQYFLLHREIGASQWQKEKIRPQDDSATFNPGNGRHEWFLRTVYTDGSTSESDIYIVEVDGTEPTIEAVAIDGIEVGGNETGSTSENLVLPLGSSLTINTSSDEEVDTIMEIWDTGRTVHYDTMVCGPGTCDRGHILNGPYTLVIYTQDEAGNTSDERIVHVSPFTTTRTTQPTGGVQGASTKQPAATTPEAAEVKEEPAASAGASASQGKPVPKTKGFDTVPQPTLAKSLWQRFLDLF